MIPKPLFTPVGTEEDIRRVARLAREIWVEHYVPIIGPAQVEYMLEKFQSETAVRRQISEGYTYYLEQAPDQAIGYLAVVPDPAAGSMMLSKIYLRRVARGHGFGRAAIRFVESVCREAGCATLWLTVNKHNRTVAWYERMGFRRTGPIVQDIGSGFVMDDYRMEKQV